MLTQFINGVAIYGFIESMPSMCWERCLLHEFSTAYVDLAWQDHRSRLRHQWARADGTSAARIELDLDPARNVAAAGALELALSHGFRRLAGLWRSGAPGG